MTLVEIEAKFKINFEESYEAWNGKRRNEKQIFEDNRAICKFILS